MSNLVPKLAAKWRSSARLSHKVALQFHTLLIQRHLLAIVPISFKVNGGKDLSQVWDREWGTHVNFASLSNFSCENFFSTQDPDAAGAHRV